MEPPKHWYNMSNMLPSKIHVTVQGLHITPSMLQCLSLLWTSINAPCSCLTFGLVHIKLVKNSFFFSGFVSFSYSHLFYSNWIVYLSIIFNQSNSFNDYLIDYFKIKLSRWRHVPHSGLEEDLSILFRRCSKWALDSMSASNHNRLFFFFMKACPQTSGSDKVRRAS